MMKTKLVSLLMLAHLGLSYAATPVFPQGITDELIKSTAVASFPEYLDLLTLPNDSIASSKDIQINAERLEQLFQKRGFKTFQFANGGKPLVLAEYPKTQGQKTVLFYIHFDGQPVIPSQWSQASPWNPVLKKKDSLNKWQPVQMQELMNENFDPELRVFWTLSLRR